MAYCLMRMEKVKTMSEMNRRMEHNYRLERVPNADKNREHLNRELVKLQTESYSTEYKRLIDKYGCKPRKDAVRGIEVVCSYSARDVGDEFDSDKWESETTEWLINTFGKENVIGVVSHRDEGEDGSAHIHAMVIPMVDGRLCAKEFMNGKTYMSNLQTSYAKKMKPLGLERGIKSSGMEHEDLRHFRGALKKEVMQDLPRPEEGERILDYYNRANEQFYTNNAKNFDKIKKLEREIIETKANSRDALKSERDWYLAQIEDIKTENKKRKKENEELKRQNKILEKENVKFRENSNEYDMLKNGLKNYSDKNKAQIIKNGIEQLIQNEREKEKNMER